MARQLVFTSAPQGLTPGRTGYCTVARHGDMRERLVPILESLSVYPSDWKPSPVICVFRYVDVGGTRFPVLSRLVDAGYDYTQRNHYLAHHLVLDPNEAEFAPPPVEIFLRWPGWLNRWVGDARWLNDSDLVNLNTLPASPTPALPALAWQSLAGDPGHAVHLLDGSQAGQRVLRCAAGRESEILYLYRESAALLSTAERWRTEFTNCLQPAEPASSFRWVGVRAGSPSDALASRSGIVLDLTKPQTLPRVPENVTVRMARGLAAMPTKRAAATPAAPRKTEATPSPLGAVEITPQAKLDAPKAPSGKTRKYWIWGGVAGVLAGIVAAVMILSPDSDPSYLPTHPTPTSHISRDNYTSTPGAATSPSANGSFPSLPSTTLAVGNEQALLDIEQLASSGKFLDALGKWKDFNDATPALAQSHIDVLDNTILPGARKEWLNAIGQISAQLNSGNANRADLAAQLAVLGSLLHAEPFPNPEEMETAEKNLEAKLNFLGQIPDAPVWIVDNFTATGTGPDYQDVSTTLAIPALAQLLTAPAGKFQVAAAPATSIVLPPTGSWFKFNVLDGDYDTGNYLILHDFSRGAAGGRYLQLDSAAPGKIKLTWRLFQPDSNFFKRFPANAPLRPISRELWLHFAAEPPLASFYLLLRRADNTAIEAWKPVSLPLTWLAENGAPAKVTLPDWLGNNLIWRVISGQSFHLDPTSLSPVASSVTAPDFTPAPTPAAARYLAADLVAKLVEKMRGEQTDLARAQQDLSDLNTAASGPADRQPPTGAIDLAEQDVKKIQRDLDQTTAAAQATALPAWPDSAAPWMFYYSLTPQDTLIFFQFTHETGPTP